MSADKLADAFEEAMQAAAPKLDLLQGLAPAGTDRPGPARVKVSFDGQGARVTFTYDKGEIDALLSPLDGSDRMYPLGLVLGLSGVNDWRTRWPRIIGTGTAERSVAALVEDVVNHGGPWLRGEDGALQRLEEFRSADVQLKTAQFGSDRRPSSDWEPVRSAWDRQALDELIAALEGLPQPMRSAEEAALAYARRYGAGA